VDTEQVMEAGVDMEDMEDTVRILVVMAAATAPGVGMVQLLVAMVLILGSRL